MRHTPPRVSLPALRTATLGFLLTTILALPSARGEPEPGGPPAVVVSLFRALQAGDASGVEACLHPESPLLSAPSWRNDDLRPAALAQMREVLAASGAEIQVLDVEAQGSRAQVTYRLVASNGGWRSRPGKVALRQAFPPGSSTGTWKVVAEVGDLAGFVPMAQRPRAGAMDLPRVETLPEAASAEGPPPVVVTLLASGDVALADRAWPLATGDPREQAASLVALRDELRQRTANPALREPDRASRVPLLIRGDRNARWQYVQWILQVAAEPTVAIYRIAFEARAARTDRVGTLDIELPRDRGLAPLPGLEEEVPEITVKIFRRNLDDPSRAYTRIRVGTHYTFELPPGAWSGNPADDEVRERRYGAVFTQVVAAIEELRRQAGDVENPRGSLEAPLPLGPASPYGDVLRVLDAFRRAGIDDVRIEGTPAPLAAVEGDLEEVEETESHEEGAQEDPFDETAPGDLIGLGGGDRGAFGLRADSTELVIRNGGGRRAATAVEEALRWLAAHQSPDGGWQAAGFASWCDGQRALAGPDGPGSALYDVGVTGLALCAYLGAGYTNRGRHAFAKVVSKGLRYLKNVQDAEGCFGPRTSQQYIYNHATAALAMVEVYGMTGSPIYKGSAQRALDFVALARNPYFAWRYGVKPGDNDTSVTSWMTMVLNSAKRINDHAVATGRPAPLVVDEEAFEGIQHWIDKMTEWDWGRTGYMQRGGSPARPVELIDRFPGHKTEAMTAVGVLTRILLGEDPRKSEIVQKGAALCAGCPPTWNPADGSIDMYYWYYGSLALFQVGGDAWSTWNEKLRAAVLESQRQDTTHCLYRGSWDPVDPWGSYGGRIYATALLALSLETYYRYDRVFATR